MKVDSLSNAGLITRPYKKSLGDGSQKTTLSLRSRPSHPYSQAAVFAASHPSAKASASGVAGWVSTTTSETEPLLPIWRSVSATVFRLFQNASTERVL